MRVSRIGEFGLIDRLAAQNPTITGKSKTGKGKLIAGIGDDTAVWYSPFSYQLATTDALVENVHFKRKLTSWEELGWKSIAVNLSDIAAMGGIPLYVLVTLGLTSETSVEDITSLYTGMQKAAAKYKVVIAGGDTVFSPVMFISVSLIGRTGHQDGSFLSRGTARPGDRIAVTGTLGNSAGGLQLLLENLKIPAPAAKILRQAHLTPVPRIKEGQLLLAHGVKCALDISDGLVGDLRHICEQSGVGARLQIDKVPVAATLKKYFGDKALPLALNGGEDYELLFTAPPVIMETVKKLLPIPVTVIGEITGANSGKVVLVNESGASVKTKTEGWDHFHRHENKIRKNRRNSPTG